MGAVVSQELGAKRAGDAFGQVQDRMVCQGQPCLIQASLMQAEAVLALAALASAGRPDHATRNPGVLRARLEPYRSSWYSLTALSPMIFRWVASGRLSMLSTSSSTVFGAVTSR